MAVNVSLEPKERLSELISVYRRRNGNDIPDEQLWFPVFGDGMEISWLGKSKLRFINNPKNYFLMK